jgi:ribonuclease HII
MDKIIIGIDEVGRGPWAGPLVVGAVILGADIKGLTDSKALTGPVRRRLATEIRNNALMCNTGWVWPDEIDDLGLTAATRLAIERALEGVTIYDQIIIDGSVNYLPGNKKVSTLVKADCIVPAVSAASIVAKVVRDEYMAEQAQKYPQYGFDKHVGYGTARHIKAIAEYGLTLLHRRSYKPIKAIINSGEEVS